MFPYIAGISAAISLFLFDINMEKRMTMEENTTDKGRIALNQPLALICEKRLT